MAATTCSPACVRWSVQTGAPGRATRGGKAVVETRPPPLLPRAARPAPHKQAPFLSLSLCMSHTHRSPLRLQVTRRRASPGRSKVYLSRARGAVVCWGGPPPANMGNPISSHVHGEGLTWTAGNQPPRSVYTPEIGTRQEWHSTGVGLPGQPGPSGQPGSVLADGWPSCCLKKQEQSENETGTQACLLPKADSSISVSRLVGSALSVTVFLA